MFKKGKTRLKKNNNKVMFKKGRIDKTKRNVLVIIVLPSFQIKVQN